MNLPIDTSSFRAISSIKNHMPGTGFRYTSFAMAANKKKGTSNYRSRQQPRVGVRRSAIHLLCNEGYLLFPTRETLVVQVLISDEHYGKPDSLRTHQHGKEGGELVSTNPASCTSFNLPGTHLFQYSQCSGLELVALPLWKEDFMTVPSRSKAATFERHLGSRFVP